MDRTPIHLDYNYTLVQVLITNIHKTVWCKKKIFIAYVLQRSITSIEYMYIG